MDVPQPPHLPSHALTSPASGRSKNIHFVLQAVLGFLGALAYNTIIFFLTVITALTYGVPQSVPTLIIFGGGGLGIVIVLFLSLYFRWWGVLAGALLALWVPFLLFGACMIFVSVSS